MDKQDLISFLKKASLTKELSEEEIQTLLSYIDVKVYKEGDFVFKEGEKGRELYLVKMGGVEVFKEVGNRFEQLNQIQEGEFFGEMAHLEDEVRSASVKALSDVEILSFHLDDLQKNQKILYSKILIPLAKTVSRHLRKTDQSLIDSLKEKLKILQAYSQVSQTLIYIVVLMAVWFNILIVIEHIHAYQVELNLIFTSLLFILFAFAAFLVIKNSGYPLDFYGLTWKKWGTFSIEAILYTLPIMLFFLVLKWVLITYVDLFKGIPLFISKKNLSVVVVVAGVFYVLLVPIQELIARGCIQSCFRNFFQGPKRVFYAILISNLLFQILHVVKDFWLALASLFLGFFWGILFEKQKSLVGVCVSHALIGAWSLFILDYDALMTLVAAAGW